MRTAHALIAKALEQLTEGLLPYVERELKSVYGDEWIRTAKASFRDQPGGEAIRWDAHSLLTVMWDQWNAVFRKNLGQTERSLISELRAFRNRWAHQGEFDFDDAYRVLDSVERILKAVESSKAEKVSREKRELLQLEFGRDFNQRIRNKAFVRDQRTTLLVYCTCCIAITAQLFSFWGWKIWMVALFIVFLFAYLIYKKFSERLPEYGPHECKKCGRIIYTDNCPYCTVPPTPSQRKFVDDQDGATVSEPVEAGAAT